MQEFLNSTSFQTHNDKTKTTLKSIVKSQIVKITGAFTEAASGSWKKVLSNIR